MKEESERPGWRIIEHHMPNATAEEKEAAYESLNRLVRLIVRVGMSLANESDPGACGDDGDEYKVAS